MRMKLSQLFLPTLKETPSDADTISQVLMIRSGMIRKISSGIYEWLPLGLRVLKKVEQIIREEMDMIGGQEVWLPLLSPKELWEETGRWNLYGKELFRIKDRKNAEFCLAPTHEEVITDIVRREVRSYRELPLMLYQFGIKFRDEIRPRFGVMRAKEFYMKDAYSFHATEEDAEQYYKKVFDAYRKICDRCGFKYRAVEAATGAIGGKFSHEFMVLADTGEEEIVYCSCSYSANVEKAEVKRITVRTENADKDLEEIHTPNLKTVEEVAGFMKENPEKFIKSLIYIVEGNPVMVLVRGDYEINETKLKTFLNCNELVLADSGTIEKVTSAPVGFAGPARLPGKVRILADYSVEEIAGGAVSGANKKDYHLKNIFISRDFQPDEIADLRKIKQGDKCPKCDKPLKFCRGIEVGHTFKLGTKYSKSMDATFLDKDGNKNNFIMGCYGIGVSRIVAAAIEQSNDKNGIIWPVNLAPYQIIILPLDYNDEQIRNISDKIYELLLKDGYSVLIDDRDERPGVKFKDADLIGIPVRITISKKTLGEKHVEFDENEIELKLRSEKDYKLIKIKDLKKYIKFLDIQGKYKRVNP